MFFKAIKNYYIKNFLKRADYNDSTFYFSHEDFPGLNFEPYSFTSSRGDKLIGGFYYYEPCKKDRIVFFDHGMWSGRRSYMREIEMLAKHGYLVYSYDHTGCMESQGDGIVGFAQSLTDLNDAIEAVKKHEIYGSLSKSVVGHSWGGFSTLNIASLQPELTHIVAMSGFISVRKMFDMFPKFMKKTAEKLYAYECEQNPISAKADAVGSLSGFGGKALVIHSEDDNLVSCKAHFDVMHEALSEKENIIFLRLSGKGHHPNYTYDAVKYKDAFFEEQKKLKKKKKLRTPEQKKALIDAWDWHRMTAQDEDVWNAIYQHLDS